MACRAKRIINLHRNGMDACNSGDFEAAVGKLRTALQEVRQIGLECYQAKIMNNLGIVLEMKGEPLQAKEHYQAALDMIQHKLGDETVIGQVMADNLDRVSRMIAVH